MQFITFLCHNIYQKIALYFGIFFTYLKMNEGELYLE
jgi:hypothetical protein